MLTKGQLVISKAGRDKNQKFIIFSIENDFVYLVDGDLRKISNPKKKKIKHIQHVKYIDEEIKNKLDNKSYLLDSDIKTALLKYSQKVRNGNKEANDLV